MANLLMLTKTLLDENEYLHPVARGIDSFSVYELDGQPTYVHRTIGVHRSKPRPDRVGTGST